MIWYVRQRWRSMTWYFQEMIRFEGLKFFGYGGGGRRLLLGQGWDPGSTHWASRFYYDAWGRATMTPRHSRESWLQKTKSSFHWTLHNNTQFQSQLFRTQTFLSSFSSSENCSLDPVSLRFISIFVLWACWIFCYCTPWTKSTKKMFCYPISLISASFWNRPLSSTCTAK